MLEKKIRGLLNDIIDKAFPDKSEAERRRYKGYYLLILSAEKKSYSGRYIPNKKQIEINNPSLGAKHLAKTCLHELSHHIDHIQHGISGHQKPFYGIYARLIYASLDLGILKKDDFKDTWSSDGKKVWKIVERYVPKKEDKKETVLGKEICIYNAFGIKEELKTNGYTWNKIEQIWQKDYNDAGELAYLEKIGVLKEKDPENPYYIIRSADMYIDAVIYIKAQGKTYDCRDILKEYGFFFDKKDSSWKVKVTSGEKDMLLSKLSSDKRLNKCLFNIVSR